MWKESRLQSVHLLNVKLIAWPLSLLAFVNDAMPNKGWDKKSNKVQIITILHAHNLAKVEKLMEVLPGSKTLVVGSSCWEENGRRTDIESASGSDSSDDSEDEYEEEAEEQDFASGSDSSEEEEEAKEDENARIALVSVTDSENPTSKLVGHIKLHKNSNHEQLLTAIRKKWANYTGNELHGDADCHVSFNNAWPGYHLKYNDYGEKRLPTPDVMDWEEVADLLGSIHAVEGEEEVNTIPIKLVNEEGNLENVSSVNLNECHDHTDLLASIHCEWVKYTGNDRPFDSINEGTAWPGFKVTYLQRCNAGSSAYYPFDPYKMPWTDVENLLYEIIVKKGVNNDEREGDEEAEDGESKD